MGHLVRLVCAALFGLAALVTVPRAAHADGSALTEPAPVPGVGQRYWGGEFDGIGVLAHVESGRIQVFAHWTEVGRYVHFGLGARDGDGACVPTRWVVVDQEQPTQAKVYDSSGQPVDILQRFAPYGTTDGDRVHAARLAIDPTGLVADCVTAFGTQGRKPTSPQVGRTRTAVLRPMTDLGYHPTHLSFPSSFGWEQDAEVQYHLDAGPGGAWEFLLVPPVPVTVQVAIPSDSELEATTPIAPLEGRDLWVDPFIDGSVVVRPTSPYGAHPAVDVTAEGLLLGSDHGTGLYPNQARVRMPVPDWSDSLAGQTLWGRAPDKWNEPYHSVLTFLDGSWVYLSDQAADPVPTGCSTSDANIRRGCHRYYYDAATGQLQIDDMLMEPTAAPDGWLPFGRDDPVRAGSSTGPVPAGTRLAYVGRGGSFGCDGIAVPARRGCAVTDVVLRLHRDGTYRFARTSSFDGVTREHHGTYRFTGTALVLDPSKFPPVRLDGLVGYWQDGTVRDLDWSTAGVYGSG